MKNNTKECNRRIAAEGLEDLLTVKLMDYRDLPKCGMAFDRVVSVGMVEHVGRDHYPLFIDCVNKVMKPGGLFLLHFISALKRARRRSMDQEIYLPRRRCTQPQRNSRLCV